MLHLLLNTRFDIAHHVSQLARFMKRRSDEHVKMALHLLGYLKKFPRFGVGFAINKKSPPGPFIVSLACDSSWADILDGPLKRHSSFGYQAFANGCCFLCIAKISPDICTSSTEAECYAFLCLAKEARFLVNLLMECEIDFLTPVAAFIDSKTAANILESWSSNARTKHWAVMNEFSRSMVIDKGLLDVRILRSCQNPADIATKSLGKVLFSEHRGRCVVRIPLGSS